jgi:hypothetical protein
MKKRVPDLMKIQIQEELKPFLPFVIVEKCILICIKSIKMTFEFILYL